MAASECPGGDTGVLTHLAHNPNPEALSRLYDLYAAAVYQLGMRAGYDREGSERLVENVFYTVWKTAKWYDGAASEVEWIGRIALAEIMRNSRLTLRVRSANRSCDAAGWRPARSTRRGTSGDLITAINTYSTAE